jgi:ubiquinone/menaquinone biosynthesis C-methylase UbiE
MSSTERRDTDGRRSAVAEFFSTNAANWRSRYSARDFDSDEYQLRARLALEWLEALARAPAADLLEIGCGAGVQARDAAAMGWRTVGMDMAKGMLQQAAEGGSPPHWIAGQIEALPFPPASFDAVLMNGVIGYLADPTGALRTVRQLLRPGGHLIISWVSPRELLLHQCSRVISAVPVALYRTAKRLLRGRAPLVAAEPGFYDRYFMRWTPIDFLALLDREGFQVRAQRSQNFGQFRFMGKSLWPESVDIEITHLCSWLSDRSMLGFLRASARTHIVLAQTSAEA